MEATDVNTFEMNDFFYAVNSLWSPMELTTKIVLLAPCAILALILLAAKNKVVREKGKNSCLLSAR
jgi:hypothetical protein